MTQKWQMSSALAKRIAKRLREETDMYLSYSDVLNAMRAESCARPDSYDTVNRLRNQLRNDGDEWAANAIADAACREAQDCRDKLKAVRHAFSVLGFVSEDQLAHGAMKDDF
jgi:hypothetical protein